MLKCFTPNKIHMKYIHKRKSEKRQKKIHLPGWKCGQCIDWPWKPSWILTNCLTDSTQMKHLNIFNGLPSIPTLSHSPFFPLNHHWWPKIFIGVILIGPSWSVNLSPDPFLVECIAAFSTSPRPHSNIFLPRHFLYSPSINIFLLRARSIFVVGTTLCLRDSTKTDFHTASSVISTLLATSSFLAASTGMFDQNAGGEEEWEKTMVKKWTLQETLRNTQRFSSRERERKHSMQFKSASKAKGSIERWKCHRQKASVENPFNASFLGER